MDDGPSNNKSFLDSLKNEWSLLWGSLLEEENPKDILASETALNNKVSQLTLDQVRNLTKGLSLERRQLNMKLEQVQKEIEELQQSAETYQEKLAQLTDQGLAYSEALHKLDEQIRCVRNRGQELLQSELDEQTALRA